jgi:hypothetical protein
VVPAPPVATGEPEPDPEAILAGEEFGDWQNMKKHLMDPDLESAFGKIPADDELEPPKHEKVEQERETKNVESNQTTVPEATATPTHDEL